MSLFIILISHDSHLRSTFDDNIVEASCNVYFCNHSYITYGINGILRSEYHISTKCCDMIHCYYIYGNISVTLTLEKMIYISNLNLLVMVLAVFFLFAICVGITIYLISKLKSTNPENIALLSTDAMFSQKMKMKYN